MRNIPQDVQTYIGKERERFAREYGVRKIALFGSVVCGDATETSDVDILVDMESPSFDRYMDLKFELEDHLGVSVDLVLADAVKERLRDVIEREAMYV